jgi:hypothetical protein
MERLCLLALCRLGLDSARIPPLVWGNLRFAFAKLDQCQVTVWISKTNSAFITKTALYSILRLFAAFFGPFPLASRAALVLIVRIHIGKVFTADLASNAFIDIIRALFFSFLFLLTAVF